MIQTVNFSEFTDAFAAYDRKENFSYQGLRALFDYLTGLEEETEQQIELDVIALCCEYTEYENLDEIKAHYEHTGIETIDDLANNTTVIEIPGTDRLIIQDF